MRQVLSGAGVDTTSTVAAYLAAGNEFRLANLYLIGDYDDPQAIRLTDWDSPLDYPIWGTFVPSVVARDTIESGIGLEVADLKFTWTPKLQAPSLSVATANPYQLAQIGFFDNKLFRCWTTFMPTPGDANSYGAAIMFGGRIAQSEIDRAQIVFTVNSFLDIVNEMVPTNVIELTRATAGYAGATPPAGCATVPQFNVISGSIAGLVIGDQVSPNVHGIFGNNQIANGFLVFNSGPGATLPRQVARVAANFGVTVSSVRYNEFILYDPLPWAPTPGVDTFYVSAGANINSGQLANVTINAAGTGYTVGDLLTPAGGQGAIIEVEAVGGGGAITAVALISGGTNYQNTTGAAVTGGTGAGATFNLILPDLTQGFPFVPSPNQAL